MRVLCLVLFVFSFLVTVGQPYSGDTWQKVQEQRHGTITLVYAETPGLVFKDSYGRFRGVCVDILNDFVKYVYNTRNVELNWNLVGDGQDFKLMYDSVRSSHGGVFGLASTTITEQRKKEVSFSPPFMNNFAILVTRTSVPMLTGFHELPHTFANLTAYTDNGTVNDFRLAELRRKYFPKMKIVHTATGKEMVDKVIADPNSFAYLDLPFYLECVQLGLPLKRHAIGDTAHEQFGFVMPLNSDWSPVLEEFFKTDGGYINSARYQSIISRHLGETGVSLLKKASGK